MRIPKTLATQLHRMRINGTFEFGVRKNMVQVMFVEDKTKRVVVLGRVSTAGAFGILKAAQVARQEIHAIQKGLELITRLKALKGKGNGNGIEVALGFTKHKHDGHKCGLTDHHEDCEKKGALINVKCRKMKNGRYQCLDLQPIPSVTAENH